MTDTGPVVQRLIELRREADSAGDCHCPWPTSQIVAAFTEVIEMLGEGGRDEPKA